MSRAKPAIRPLAVGDEPALARLYADVDADHAKATPGIFRQADPPRSDAFYARYRDDPDCLLLVAAEGADIVGLVEAEMRSTPPVRIFVPKRIGVINTVVVRKDRRRHGIGRALVEDAERRLIGFGASEIEVTVYDWNVLAAAFYRRLGFAATCQKMVRAAKR